jgi:hypothetical protein
MELEAENVWCFASLFNGALAERSPSGIEDNRYA